jgi:hypothetical protein
MPLMAIGLALGQPVAWGRPTRQPEQAEAMIRSLYALVIVDHHSIGISTPHFLDRYAPYLSERLIRRIKSDRLCEGDWYRQYRTWKRRQPPDLELKPPFAWLELGLFSGDEERSDIGKYQIEGSAPREGGSTDVHVKLTAAPQTYSADLPKMPTGEPSVWDVTVRVVKERGRVVVDDVNYLTHKDYGFESSLSQSLWIGCRGSRWVGRIS